MNPYAYKRGPAAPRKRYKTPEADFQKALIVYLSYALPPAFRFRAGLEGAKRTGWQGAEAKRMGMRKGWLDIEIMHRTEGWVRWMEAKSLTGQLTPEQREFI